MTILHSTDFFKAGISTVAIEPRLPQSAFPEHHHDFHEIVIVEQGSGIHVFNGQPYTIGGGSVCFIRDHDRHLYEHTDNLCLTNVLYRAPDAFRFLAGVSQLLPQEQEGNYPSHWRVNQTVLQQVRHIVAQIEAVGGETDTHAVASREILFMQLLVLLRKKQPCGRGHQQRCAAESAVGLARRPFCAGDLLGRRWRRSFRCRCVRCTAS